MMRFLTLGSTLSMPNQPLKIISTGNAFLTSKNWSPNSLNWSFSYFFFFFLLNVCVCVCFFYVLAIFWRLWFRHYKMAQDTSEDYFLNVVEVREAPAGDLFFSKPALYCCSTRRGLGQKTDERAGGMEGGREGGGGGERAGSDELEPKRKTHSFSSAGWEGGNSQLCRHNMTMDVGCEVQSCCDWQAGEEEKDIPLFPPTI